MQRWTVYDRYGDPVYMTSERWQHALEKRSWLADCFDDVLDTLRRGRRRQDPLNPHKYKYAWPCYRLGPEFNHIVVVMLFGEKIDDIGQRVANNYVTNVWAVFVYGRG